MISLENKTIHLACGSTDMRKSINGLVAMVSETFNLDPFGIAIFVFCNKKRDRIKILEWDGDGFWIHFKRLEKGSFRWPTFEDDPIMTLSYEEFWHLIGSTKVIQKILRKELKIEAVV